MYSVYMKQSAVKSAEEHFRNFANQHLEAMGLLLGEVCEHKGQEFIVIDKFATTSTDATAVSVRFSPTAFGSLAQQLKQKLDTTRVVGWCHSHPGYGCFLSSTDVSTQRRFFNEKYHVAAVFDPLREEFISSKKVMSKRFYRLNSGNYEEVSFAVFLE